MVPDTPLVPPSILAHSLWGLQHFYNVTSPKGKRFGKVVYGMHLYGLYKGTICSVCVCVGS